MTSSSFLAINFFTSSSSSLLSSSSFGLILNNDKIKAIPLNEYERIVFGKENI